MGREVKRVQPDFNWPLNKVWKGFINPYYELCSDCQHCENGYNAYGHRLHSEWYGYVKFDPDSIGAKPLQIDDPYLKEVIENKIKWSQELAKREGKKEYYTDNGRITFVAAVKKEVHRMYNIYKNQWCHQLCQADIDALLKEGRLQDFTRRGITPTADEVNAWSLSGMGHDAINQWVCLRARAEREGQEYTCLHCEGSGIYWNSPEDKTKAENWKQEEPPTGEAYQIWETVSEGSPVSPPFLKPEVLADWMVKNDNSITKDTTREGWLKFILGPGWSPSMIGGSTGFISGVKAVTE